MTFICYPKCSTCRKAQDWLDANGIAYELRDIKTENPAYDELAAWHKLSGLPLKRFFITCVCGTAVTFFYVKAATRHTYKGYELESFLTNFGTVTGTVSTGMILLREIDPNYVTPAASNIVLQNIPSLVMLAPLLLTMGFAASSLQHTLIMLGVYAFLLIAYNIFLFRLSIFKKRYTGAADELSAGVHDR